MRPVPSLFIPQEMKVSGRMYESLTCNSLLQRSQSVLFPTSPFHSVDHAPFMSFGRHGSRFPMGRNSFATKVRSQFSFFLVNEHFFANGGALPHFSLFLLSGKCWRLSLFLYHSRKPDDVQILVSPAPLPVISRQPPLELPFSWKNKL